MQDKDLPIEYIQGDSFAFKAFTDANNAVLTNIEGKNRWVVLREDGTKYIARPQDAQENN
jgi:hypothetical protein